MPIDNKMFKMFSKSC